MVKYSLKRILLMFVTLFIVIFICFVLLRSIYIKPACLPASMGGNCEAIYAWEEAMGYNKPIMVQFGIYISKLFQGDFGIGLNMYQMKKVTDVVGEKLPATVAVNLYTMIFAIPIGLLLGTFAALKKNKWQDQLISVLVMLTISVPSYVYCFIVFYFFCFKWKIFPMSLPAGTDFFSFSKFVAMIPACICLGLGTIAGLTRYTRAELTEVLTSEYMLLARAKGLTRRQATFRHAFRNSMVPVFPMILGEVIGVLGGSLIVENFFGIPGVGSLYIDSISKRDTNFYMFLNIFYVSIGLVAGLVVDLSYGLIDPRIRMGAKK